MFGRDKEKEALKEENQRLMKLLEGDRKQKCERDLYIGKEGYILDVVKKYPLVGLEVINVEYHKGKLLKFFATDGLEKYRMVGYTPPAKPVKTVFFPVKKKAKPIVVFAEKKYNGKTKKVVNKLREEGKSYIEISKETGIPKGSIGHLLKHSMKKKYGHKKKQKRKGSLPSRNAKLLKVLKEGEKTTGDLIKETGFKKKDVYRLMYNLRQRGFIIKTNVKGKWDKRVVSYDLLSQHTRKVLVKPTKPAKKLFDRWAKVAALVKKGMSRSEMAKELDLTAKQLGDSLWYVKNVKKIDIPAPEYHSKGGKKKSEKETKWRTVTDLAMKGLKSREIAEQLGLTVQQVSTAKWSARVRHGITIPNGTHQEVGKFAEPTSPPSAPEESEYVKKAREGDKIDLKELCEAVGVDFYHYCDVRRKVGFKSPYEYLLTKMLLSKSIRDSEAPEFLNIALKRAGIDLPTGLRMAICERAISFHKLPHIQPTMKQKLPDELEAIGISFTDVEDFLSDFIFKPELKLTDWKQFVRNYGELKEIDFRNSFDFLTNIIAQFFRRNQYSVKISYSSYDKCYYFKTWRRVKSGV